ncbi:MAG: flagellar type III secretion system pore protein FliP [Clostridium butyricum]|nr:flagellar type III secretion system pore protein FliP [Clostridium butyricum]
MKKNKRRIVITFLAALSVMMFWTINAYAAPSTTDIPQLNISFGNGTNTPNDYVNNIKILIFFTILALLPSIVIMVTSFTRIVVVFSFLKTAIGLTQSIPNQILTGLAIFLTLFIMHPVYNEMNSNGIQPYLENQITQEQAIDEIAKPLKEFMAKQTREDDLELFVDINNVDKSTLGEAKDVPFTCIVPAFAISELKTAFQIGFLIFLPFLVIDMVVSSVLMSMGMFMLPPTTVALPFKLILFVMVDGWHILVESLIKSFM